MFWVNFMRFITVTYTLRPFIFNLLVYETGDRIFSKSGKKIKNRIAGFYFCRWSKNHEYEK